MYSSGKSVNPKDAVGYRFGLDHISVVNQLISMISIDPPSIGQIIHYRMLLTSRNFKSKLKGDFSNFLGCLGDAAAKLKRGCQIETRLLN